MDAQVTPNKRRRLDPHPETEPSSHRVAQRPIPAAPASLSTLPNELLLEIIDYLPHLPLDRRTALVALSRVPNKHISAVATEILHKNVCVHMENVPRLLDLYVAKPKVAEYVRCLELYGRNPIKNKKRFGPISNIVSKVTVQDWCCTAVREVFATEGTFCSYHQQEHAKRTTAYASFVWKSGLPVVLQKELIQGCLRRKANAHVAIILLVLLPNIQGLYLGRLANVANGISLGHDLYFDFRDSGPTSSSKASMQRIFDLLAPKLITLELLGSWLYMTGRGPSNNTAMNLSPYASLTTLIAPCNALMHVCHTWSMRGSGQLLKRFAIPPPTLKKLTIEGGPIEDRTTALLLHLLDVQKSGSLPNLRQMNVYVPFSAADGGNSRDTPSHVNPLDAGVSNSIADSINQFQHLGVSASLKSRNRYEIASQFRLIPQMGETLQTKHCVWQNDLEVLEVRGCFEYLKEQSGK
jgi:hypothetical protein